MYKISRLGNDGEYKPDRHIFVTLEAENKKSLSVVIGSNSSHIMVPKVGVEPTRA